MVMSARYLAPVTMMLLCLDLAAAAVRNCSYPAVYAFGDSLSDVGNSIAAFPRQFRAAELPPNGVQFPSHPADRFCDGKLLVDYLAFGVGRRPMYPVLRGTAPDFTYGVSFAASGATARPSRGHAANFTSPFSLDVQLEWLLRYKTRLLSYETQDPVIVVQSLPTVATLNSSLYVVYAGFQDYFSSLYHAELTPDEALLLHEPVVDAILDLIKGVVDFGARDIMVVNLPPLGCIPAMLTLFLENSTAASYDSRGCLKMLNTITRHHNALLEKSVIALRVKHPAVKLFYGDLHSVYIDILKHPRRYNVTHPLKACCGTGGHYGFNTGVTCGNTGVVGNAFVNLTVAHACGDRLSWDGIHTSDAFNKHVVTAFLKGKHITPRGGLRCSPDFSNFDARF